MNISKQLVLDAIRDANLGPGFFARQVDAVLYTCAVGAVFHVLFPDYDAARLQRLASTQLYEGGICYWNDFLKEFEAGRYLNGLSVYYEQLFAGEDVRHMSDLEGKPGLVEQVRAATLEFVQMSFPDSFAFDLRNHVALVPPSD